MRMHNPPHPGLIVKEYLDGITVSAAAVHLGITRTALSRIINAKTGISPEIAIRLEEAFGLTTAETWLTMQGKYDLWKAMEQHKKLRRMVIDLLLVALMN